jgi:hypothetical protein
MKAQPGAPPHLLTEVDYASCMNTGSPMLTIADAEVPFLPIAPSPLDPVLTVFLPEG